MTAADAPAAETPARRRPVWVIGAVLWGGVFAALAAVFLMRGDAAEPPPGAGTGEFAVVQEGEGGKRLAPVGATGPAAVSVPVATERFGS